MIISFLFFFSFSQSEAKRREPEDGLALALALSLSIRVLPSHHLLILLQPIITADKLSSLMENVENIRHVSIVGLFVVSFPSPFADFRLTRHQTEAAVGETFWNVVSSKNGEQRWRQAESLEIRLMIHRV